MGSARIDLVCVDLALAQREPRDNISCLTADERSRANRFRLPGDAERWAMSRTALRRVLGGFLGRSPASLRFHTGHNGKPSIEGVYFNLSHSGDLAMIALTQQCEVGVDVELCRELPDRDAVARRFFSAVEQKRFFELPEAQRTLAFYRCWTRKEAVIKATGEGLSADLTAFDVTLGEQEPARVLRHRIHGGADQWQLLSGEPHSGYQFAVAIRASAAPELALVSYADYCREHAIG